MCYHNSNRRNVHITKTMLCNAFRRYISDDLRKDCPWYHTHHIVPIIAVSVVLRLHLALHLIQDHIPMIHHNPDFMQFSREHLTLDGLLLLLSCGHGLTLRFEFVSQSVEACCYLLPLSLQLSAR